MLAGTAMAAAGLPRRAKAAAPSDTCFLFVFAQGGWDPTRVFVPSFSNHSVSMESRAEKATAGGISYVSHPDRPSVDAFFRDYHERMVVFNGMMVRSIAHEICTMIAMTGTTSGVTPDWPAIIASRDAGSYVLPHVVIGGPSFPGDLGAYVSRTGSNGQLEALISGQSRSWSDVKVGGPSRPAEALLDRYLSRRAAARATWGQGRDAALTGDFSTAVAHLRALKDLQYVMDFTGGTDLGSQAEVACDALELGITRCVTLAGETSFSWDTHSNNDDGQSPLWEDLFSGLAQLLGRLDSTPGPGGGTLADQTVVVVLSEMGRTPMLNSFNGKDHWPYTSALVLGPGLTGDRTVGDLDSDYYGKNVDPGSGEVSEQGQVLSAEALGATLLQMADIDPEEWVSGVEPISGILG
jgi:hypothetical protein